MNSWRMSLLIFCLGGLLCRYGYTANEAAPDEGDRIERFDKLPAPIGGKIKSDDYIYVVVKKGQEVKIPSYAIKEVVYADGDANYNEAIKQRDDGRYTKAAQYFQKALESLTAQKWAPEYCNYGMGDAFYKFGKFTGYKGRSGTQYSPPSVYYRKALEANPKSRFMPDIVVKLPICLAEEGKLDEADAALKDAEERIKKYRDEAIKVGAGYGEIADHAAAQIAVADARIAERKAAAGKGNLSDVLDKWQSARSKCVKFPDMYGEVVDGVLKVLVQDKKYTQAISEAETIIDNYAKDNDQKWLAILPSAYTARGKANLALAVDHESKKQKLQANAAYADARWDFMYVIGQFFDNDEYLASAHFLAGVCYEKLKDIESDSHEKAVREWKLVIKNFPTYTNFVEASKKELASVGEKLDDAPPTGAETTPAAAVPAKPKK